MKTPLFTLLLLLIPITGAAQTFTVDGLNYTVTATTPNEVQLTGGTSPTTDLVIPAQVSDNGVDYAVVSIANNAFEDSGLTSVSFPDTLRDLGEATFRNNALANVIVPEGITEVPRRCFASNELTSVTLPSTLEIIGFRSFERNDITNITFPDGITTIEGFAFDRNDLTILNFPSTLQTIGAEAFNGNSLTDITLSGTTPPGIQNNSFVNRQAIRLFVPEGSEQDYLDGGWTGFAGINDDVILTTFTVDQITYRIISTTNNEVETFGISTTGAVTVPETVASDGEEYTVTTIGRNSFRQQGLTAVTLPATIVEIKQEGLSRNPLTAITLPEGITSLGQGAFIFCDLQSVTIPNSVIAMGRDAFRGNSNLSTATLPNNIEALPRGLFRGANLSTIDIPESVTEIGQEAFIDNNLTAVTIPNAVQTIAADAFENNDIETISLGSGLQSIGNLAFNNNPLTTITSLNTTPPSIASNTFGNNRDTIDLLIPQGAEIAYADGGWTGFASVNGVQPLDVGNTFEVQDLLYTIVSLLPNEVHISGGNTIPTDLSIPESVDIQDVTFMVSGVGDSAFRDSGITNLTLPNTIREFGESAFALNGLTSVVVPDGITELSNRCFSGNNLTNINLPTSLEVIGFRALEDNNIENISIPPNVTTLDDFAFRNNDIQSITIPSSVTSVGEDTFFLNPLNEIVNLGVIPATPQSDSFPGRSQIDLFVPVGTTQAYLDAGWTGFNAVTEFNLIALAPKIFLQGAAINPIAGEEGLMRDSLRANNLLPTTSPYGDGATVDTIVLDTTGANAIVDWVFIELRTGTDSNTTTVVAPRAALLQRDGDIVALDGVSNLFYNLEAGDYFVAIKHRNHLGVLTAAPITLDGTVSSLDFTLDPATAKGANLALTQVNGTFAMIAGDADGSSQILNTDVNTALNLAGGSAAYSAADADMNGFVLNSDIQLLVLSNSGTVQQFE